MSDLIECIDHEIDGCDDEVCDSCDLLRDCRDEIERLRAALEQIWDCEEGACPHCKLIAREALKDD